MKAIVLYLIFVSLPLHFLAQDSHEILESFFLPKPIHVFEENIGVTPNDYQNQAFIDHIDYRYQIFRKSIEERVEQNEIITDSAFQMEYTLLVDSVKNEKDDFNSIPNSPGNKAPNGPCVNMDFEQGDLSGWTLIRGDVDGSAPYSFVNPFLTGPGPYHQIFGGGVDPVCGISRVNPLGGNFSTRLGNGTGVGARAAKMTQTFLVDATNYLFTYSYAVVFQSPAGHPLNALPYFTVRVYDAQGNNVPCGEYSVIADQANAPGYQQTTFGGSVVLYKDWQSVFVNLTALIGQNVTVEFTAGDCSYTGHFGYAYVDASCAMQQIIASQNIICQGDSATLTAPPGAASYLWSNGATTQSTVVYNGGNYSCTLTPFAGGGCSITLDVTITENPSPTADFIPSTNVLCANDTVSFLNNSTIPNPGVITGYKWDFGDGAVTNFSMGNMVGVTNSSGTYLNPNHWYTNGGTYNVTLYVQSADGCLDSISNTLTVNALPNVVANATGTVLCENASVTLTGSGAVYYVWDNNVIDGVSFIPPVGTTTYTVVGTDANGCSNSASVDILVNALPNVVANATGTVLCENASVTLTGSGAVSYVWDNNVIDGVSFIPPVGTTTYTVTGTDANGCMNSASVDILVNPLPNVVANATGTVLCENASATLTGSGAVSYVWDNNVIDGVSFIPPVGTTTYTVIGTDANGCSNSASVDILVNALPNVVANATGTILCENASASLTGSGAVSYVWDNNVIDGVSFIPPVGTTTYTVIGTDANGCSNSASVDILVNALPNVVANATGIILCENASTTLTGSGAVSYVWDNNVIDGVSFIPPVGTTTYTVTGTDANGCMNSASVDILVNALPNVVANATGTVLCENASTTLTGSGAVSYVWDNNVIDGVSFIPPVGTTTYTVVGTDANGCSNSASVDILVNPLPNVVGGNDVEICDGNSVTLSATGANSFSWTGGIQNGVAFYPAVGQYTHIVTGTDINNCQNLDTVQVLVNPNPIVNAGNDVSACAGDSIVLNATGSPSPTWNMSIQNNVPFLQNIGTQFYIASDTLPTGCFDADTVMVKVNPNPVVTSNNAEICEGEGVTLFGQGALTYDWSDGVIDGVTFYPTISHDYQVVGTDVNGCTGRATAKVIVNPNPVADFIWLEDEVSTVSPIAIFDNLSTGGSIYAWDFNDFSSTSYEFEPVHTFPDDQGGIYVVTLTVTSDKGCIDEVQKYITVEQDYTIFVPNAFTPDGDDYNQFFKPEMTGFDEYDYTLYIFNRWGELIFESHDMSVGWNGTYASGEYGQSQDGVFTWKIIAKVKNSGERKQFVGHVALLK